MGKNLGIIGSSLLREAPLPNPGRSGRVCHWAWPYHNHTPKFETASLSICCGVSAPPLGGARVSSSETPPISRGLFPPPLGGACISSFEGVVPAPKYHVQGTLIYYFDVK